MRIWVDTDFGFDDLWALLLLDHFGFDVEGVSLVAGNTALPQVINNAQASVHAFELDWPVYAGASIPIKREPETAERILGQLGMQSRGLYLPYGAASNSVCSYTAIDAMAAWLDSTGPHHIIALGPLSNLAQLTIHYPELTHKITQITWLGGSRGRGNHTEFAEYNALADPEALSVVIQNSISFRMIDLELCRQVNFAESDIPKMCGKNQQLVSDLLGGYLDIAVHRGRSSMSIYDPLAALSVTSSDLFEFAPASLIVDTNQGAQYGRTVVDVSADISTFNVEIATKVDAVVARMYCLASLVDV